MKEKVPLEGEELEVFLKEQAEKKALEEQEAFNRSLIEREDELSDEEELLPETTDKSGQGVQQTFDIFVKDAARSSGFFKHAQMFKMYPVHEARVRVDAYGELIDPGAYMKEEEQTAIEAAAMGVKIPKPAQDEEEEEEEEEVIEEDATPFKYVESQQDLSIQCQIMYIDFEGRSDGKSVRNILSQVLPRKIVIYNS